MFCKGLNGNCEIAFHSGWHRAAEPFKFGRLYWIAVCIVLTLAWGCPAQQKVRATAGLVRSLIQEGQYSEAEKAAYHVLWDDMEQPKVLYDLAAALKAQGRGDDAAVYLSYWLRMAENPKFKVSEAQKKIVASELENLNVAFEALRKKHRDSSGRVFKGPKEVDDLWMTDVTVDLFSYYMLHHWVVVGGVKRRPAHWSEGTMHRSGARLLRKFKGRKGVLYTKTIKREDEGRGDKMHEFQYKRLGRTPRIAIANPSCLKILRVGTRGDGKPYLLVVHAGGKEIASQKVETDKWQDLQFDLGEAADKGELFLELTVPAGQKYSGEAAFDYIEVYKE